MTDKAARDAERVTIDEARERSGAGGYEPDAPSFGEETGTTYLGVKEPTVLPPSDETRTQETPETDGA